jgi:hypothetical protein
LRERENEDLGERLDFPVDGDDAGSGDEPDDKTFLVIEENDVWFTTAPLDVAKIKPMSHITPRLAETTCSYMFQIVGMVAIPQNVGQNFPLVPGCSQGGRTLNFGQLVTVTLFFIKYSRT